MDLGSLARMSRVNPCFNISPNICQNETLSYHFGKGSNYMMRKTMQVLENNSVVILGNERSKNLWKHHKNSDSAIFKRSGAKRLALAKTGESDVSIKCFTLCFTSCEKEGGLKMSGNSLKTSGKMLSVEMSLME
ncbi:hypothetical protein TNCV_3946031 [Trichonephila clavipes]|nr:hypothetical protein TNCV_3946031 [Trichonephila clavipes]